MINVGARAVDTDDDTEAWEYYFFYPQQPGQPQKRLFKPPYAFYQSRHKTAPEAMEAGKDALERYLNVGSNVITLKRAPR